MLKEFIREGKWFPSTGQVPRRDELGIRRHLTVHVDWTIYSRANAAVSYYSALFDELCIRAIQQLLWRYVWPTAPTATAKAGRCFSLGAAS